MQKYKIDPAKTSYYFCTCTVIEWLCIFKEESSLPNPAGWISLPPKRPSMNIEGHREKSNLTAGTVKKEIIKGVTTQAKVMQLFGSPNLMTMDSDGNEVWNYNKMSYTTTTGHDGGSLIFWGGSRSMRSSTTQSFDLIIVFDSNDVVRDYRVISAAY